MWLVLSVVLQIAFANETTRSPTVAETTGGGVAWAQLSAIGVCGSDVILFVC
jgi:hypothetical protein